MGLCESQFAREGSAQSYKQNVAQMWRVSIPFDNHILCRKYSHRDLYYFTFFSLRQIFSQSPDQITIYHSTKRFLVLKFQCSFPCKYDEKIYSAKIDLDDWRKNTKYGNLTKDAEIVIWFWDILAKFTDVEIARLLQFCTGTSRVPLAGFSQLRGIFVYIIILIQQ